MAKKLKVKKILKRIAIAIVLLLLAGFLFLMYNGVPKPRATSTEGVPRIPWIHLLKTVSALKGMASAYFGAWYPSERRMLIYDLSRFTFRLHTLSEPGGQPQKVKFLQNVPEEIRFNPDANKNYFVGSMDVDGDECYQLYRYNLSDNSCHRLTDGTLRNYPGYFNTQGNLLAYTKTQYVKVGGDTEIHIIDPEQPETKSTRYQLRGGWTLGHWSPAGSQILAWKVTADEKRLHLFDVETGEMKDLFPNETSKVTYGPAVWSKEGKSIYFVSDKDGEFMTLRCLDLSTGDVQLITAHIPWDVEDCIISPEGDYLALKINEHGFSTMYLFNTGTGTTRKVDDLPDGLVGKICFHPQRNEIAIGHVSPTGFPSIYSYDVDLAQLTLWTKAPVQNTEELPAVRLIHYPTFDEVDGKPRLIPAFVFDAAADFEGPRPVLIDLHGGPTAQAQPISSPPFNGMRRQGITVITPNYRGSTGYGKTFTALDDGYLREGAVKDIGALIDWIATQPDLDTQRIAVSGSSYGGYLALATLVHYSDRLRCGIDIFGISNFVALIENNEIDPELDRVEFGDVGDPKMRTFLESISPVNHADKIKVSLLVFQGKNDPYVPIRESRQIVDKVQAQGGEVWYIEAANEGHGVMEPMNGIYLHFAASEFLRKHLLEKN